MIRDRLIPAARLLLQGPPPAPQPTPQSPPVQSALSQVMGEMASRQDAEPVAQRFDGAFYSQQTGLGGTSDKSVLSRPTLRGFMTWPELEFLYYGSGMCRRAVNAVPDAAMRRGWTTVGEEDDEVLEKVATYERTLQVNRRINRLWKLARFYGHSLGLVVVEETRPTDLSTPLILDNVRRVRAIEVFDAKQCSVAAYNQDLTSGEWNEPLQWNLTATSIGGTTLPAGQTVHASRVLFFRGIERAPSLRYDQRWGQFLGVSILQVIIDVLRNVDTVAGSAGIIAGEMRIDTIKVGNLSSRSVSSDADAFDQRMKQIAVARSVLNMVLLGADEEYQTRAATVSGYRELYDAIIDQLCIETGYPRIVWTGQAPAGMNTDGESWQQGWSNIVADEWQEGAYPQAVKLYRILRAAKEAPDENWDLQPRPIHEPTEKELADIYSTNATADAVYMDRGADPEFFIRGRFTGPKGYRAVLPPMPEEQLPPPADALAEAAAEGAAKAKMEAVQAAAPQPPTSPVAGEPPEPTPEVRGEESEEEEPSAEVKGDANAAKGSNPTRRVFAYGSLLDESEVRRDYPSARLIGPASNDGWHLGFRRDGKGTVAATLIPDKSASCPGLLWEFSPDDLAALDKREGVDDDEYTRERRRYRVNSHDVGAFAYVMSDPGEPGMPSPAYLTELRQGYRAHGFPLEHLETAINEAKA